MAERHAIALRVNGCDRALAVATRTTLLEALREQLGLTGAKRGCNQGVCGACTVLAEGRPVRACLTLAIDAVDREIVTIEGLARGRALAPVQEAMVEGGAVQCGFCTPGLLLVADAFLRERPGATTEEIRAALAGNLCRCSGYRKVVVAVARAAAGDRP